MELTQEPLPTLQSTQPGAWDVPVAVQDVLRKRRVDGDGVVLGVFISWGCPYKVPYTG